MAEHGEDAKAEQSMMEKISEKIHDHHDSSSSLSSVSVSEKPKPAAEESPKEKVFRLFGRERPVHHVLGGGKRKFFYCFTFTDLLSVSVELIWF